MSDARNASISSTRLCATARRPPASSSRSRTRSRSRGCSRSWGSTTSRAAIPAPTSSTTQFFAETRTTRATFTAFGMTKRSGRSVGNDPGVQAIAQRDAPTRPALSPRPRTSRSSSRSASRREENLKNLRETVEAVGRGRQGDADRLRALLRRLQGQPGLCAALA